jgi:hypothetical protein
VAGRRETEVVADVTAPQSPARADESLIAEEHILVEV